MRMVLSCRASAVVAVCGALVGSSCGDGSSKQDAAALVATTTIWADIASHVNCDQPVPSVIPAGADPHTFEASLRDRELLEQATVIIANGGGLEGSTGKLLEAAQSSGVQVVEMMPFARPLAGDPHIWQDPSQVVELIDEIEAAAISAGFDADAVTACSDDYRAELIALDAEIVQLLAPIPPESRVIVTSHDSLAYFADRYDVEIVGTVIDSTNTLAETNAADLAALADTIEELGVPAVFTEQLESSNDANRLAERLGVRVVPLVTDAVTDAPATDTYLEMMRANATAIARALAP